METKTTYKHRGYDLFVRDERDLTVCKEVISRDCYGLMSLQGTPDIAIDIGAHIGSFTHLLHTLYPDAKCICVEPVKENFDLLKDNTPFASLHNVAIWHGIEKPILYHTEAQTGSDVITIPEVANGELLNDFFNALGYKYEVSPQEVQTTTLAQLLANEDIDFREKAVLLKLDCEGAESHILDEIAHEDMGYVFAFVCGEWHHDYCGPEEELKRMLTAAFPHLEFTIDNNGINSIFCSW